MTFSVGDKAVYPVQGVTEILGIEDIEVSGFTSRVYILRRLDSEDTIRVPVSNVERVGLRHLVSSEEIVSVLGVLSANEMWLMSLTGIVAIGAIWKKSKVGTYPMSLKFCEIYI